MGIAVVGSSHIMRVILIILRKEIATVVIVIIFSSR